jgi:hypothetical protein
MLLPASGATRTLPTAVREEPESGWSYRATIVLTYQGSVIEVEMSVSFLLQGNLVPMQYFFQPAPAPIRHQHPMRHLDAEEEVDKPG